MKKAKKLLNLTVRWIMDDLSKIVKSSPLGKKTNQIVTNKKKEGVTINDPKNPY